jgi:uncharacterized membrane protein required for colicin V production
MTPDKLTELYKKYGSNFLLWCAIAFLYSEVKSYKDELAEVQSKLYSCLEIRANTSKVHYNNNIRTNFAVLTRKKRYEIKRNKKPLEV